MINKLTATDYKNVLQFYNTSIPKSKKLLKKEAEHILAEKLCTCIKKVGSSINEESRAIGICTKTIFNRKGLTRGNFTCKGNRHITTIGKKYKTLNIRKKNIQRKMKTRTRTRKN